jgi:PPOX class probable F420-dependent enzyme
MELAEGIDYIRRHRNGVLTTIKRDGRPQLSNIVYRVDDDGVVLISLTDDRAKTRNLRRDPRASLHVTASDFGSYCVVEGDVTLTPPAADPHDATADLMVEYYRALVGEHDDWDDYRRAMVDDARLLARLVPSRAYGMLSR